MAERGLQTASPLRAQPSQHDVQELKGKIPSVERHLLDNFHTRHVSTDTTSHPPVFHVTINASQRLAKILIPSCCR